LTSEARADLGRLISEIRERRDRQTKAGLPTTGADFNQLAIAEGRLASFTDDGTPRRLAMGVRERAEPADSPLYIRGEVEKPDTIVPRGLVQVLAGQPIVIPSGSSGRLELAEWLASPQNPLTARVFVNRVWLHLFGRGIVATPDNFGAAGLPPSNQPLLDDLAVSFMEDGWSVKRLIRRLVLSRAYHLGTRYDATNFKADPDNVLVWRMTSQRLEAEALRDALLAVSGQLVRTPPAGSPVASVGEGPSTLLIRQVVQLDSRDFHRAVYLPVLRDSVLESLALFDYPDTNQVVGERVATNVPAQGLFLLNSPFVQARADAAADRLLAAKIGDAARLRLAYLTMLGRPPTDRERQAAERFLTDYPRTLARDGLAAGQQPKATWAALCQALFASADFLYRN
jgi:hypothetical protein